MPVDRANFSSIVRNEEQIKDVFETSIIKYIYQDILEAATSTIEVELEPFYIPKINRGDSLEFKLKYVDGIEENNSGTLIVDDIVVTPGNVEKYSIGATAYDYTKRQPDDQPVTYNGSIFIDVITNQADYFRLEYFFPFVRTQLQRDFRAGFYRAKTNDRNEAVIEMNQLFNRQSLGYSIFEISADSRIEMLKQLAKMYGFAFNMKLGRLHFLHWFYEIFAARSFATIRPEDTFPGTEFREKTKDIFSAVDVNYAVIQNNQVIGINSLTVSDVSTAGLANAQYIPPTNEIYPGNFDAILRGIGILIERNADRRKCFMTIKGNPVLTTGRGVTLEGFRNYNGLEDNNGKWVVARARQRFDYNGWFSDLELWHANNVDIRF